MEEFDRRESIRRTWGEARLYRNTQIGTFFLVGREKNAAIIREAEGKVNLSFTKEHFKGYTVHFVLTQLKLGKRFLFHYFIFLTLYLVCKLALELLIP